MVHHLSRSLFFTACLILIPTVCHAQTKPSGDPAIISAGEKLELVFDGASILTEGVASAPDGTMYFSDITFTHLSKDEHGVSEAGHIWKYDPRSRETTVFVHPAECPMGSNSTPRGT
jgi:gluconolactonase